MIDVDRKKPWTLDRDPSSRAYPFVVRSKGKVVCRVKSEEDARRICSGDVGAGNRSGGGGGGGAAQYLREAGERAADLRRFKMKLDQLQQDIGLLMHTLDDVGQVLKQVRPRDVVRAREQIRRMLARMKGRGYVK